VEAPVGAAVVISAGALALAQAELGWLEEHFVRLIDADRVGLPFAALALAVAVGIGMVHALAPGHGKAVIAAYLVGSRGRPRDALTLGGVVAAMHTGSVLVLGLSLYLFTRAAAGADRLAPVLSLLAGLLIVAVGAGLVHRQVRLHRCAHVRTSGERAPHHHDHDHGHDLPEEVSPLSRRGLVLLGVSGGLLPSPSAFLVLATALFVGRAAFGLLLVAAFSVGLAASLTAIGLATLRGRDLLARRAVRNPRLARVTGVLPLVSAVAVLAGGLWVTTLAALRL